MGKKGNSPGKVAKTAATATKALAKKKVQTTPRQTNKPANAKPQPPAKRTLKETPSASASPRHDKGRDKLERDWSTPTQSDINKMFSGPKKARTTLDAHDSVGSGSGSKHPTTDETPVPETAAAATSDPPTPTMPQTAEAEQSQDTHLQHPIGPAAAEKTPAEYDVQTSHTIAPTEPQPNTCESATKTRDNDIHFQAETANAEAAAAVAATPNDYTATAATHDDVANVMLQTSETARPQSAPMDTAEAWDAAQHSAAPTDDAKATDMRNNSTTSDSQTNHEASLVVDAIAAKTRRELRRKRVECLHQTLFSWPLNMVQTVAALSAHCAAATPTTETIDVDTHADSGCSENRQRLQHGTCKETLTLEYAQCLRSILSSLSMSTSFSGIDAPATALAMLSGGIVASTGEVVTAASLPKVRNTWAVEWASCAQEELLRHPFGPRCVFSDICDFWFSSVSDKLDTLSRERRCVEVLKTLMTSTVCTKRSGYCLRCEKICQVACEDIHLGGTPCTDFSARGTRDEMQGQTTWALMAWIAMRRDIQEPYWAQENVCEFPVSFLQEQLQDLYEVQSVVVDPATLGWPVTRRRQYVVGRHRQKTVPWNMRLDAFVSHFTHPPKCDTSGVVPPWDIFFVASDHELRDELNWAGSRPTSAAADAHNDSQSAFEQELERQFDLEDDNVFSNCLTYNEHRYKEKYESMSRNRCYSLSQNPQFGPNVCSWDHLNTILKNAGIIWSDYHNRWLCAGEALLAQGIPIYKRLSFGVCMSPWALEDSDASHSDEDNDNDTSSKAGVARVPPRAPTSRTSRTSKIGMAGNTMHTECVALILLFIISHGAMPLHQLRRHGIDQAVCAKTNRRSTSGLSSAMSSIARFVSGS